MAVRKTSGPAAVAQAIREAFISPNVSDYNFEPANVTDTIARVGDGLFAIAASLDRVAEAIEHAGSGE